MSEVSSLWTGCIREPPHPHTNSDTLINPFNLNINTEQCSVYTSHLVYNGSLQQMETQWWWGTTALMKLHHRPGRLLRLFLEPKSLTLEKTFSRLGFSQPPLALLGLLTQRQALVFSRSLACLFCLMRELAIAAAMASLAARWKKKKTSGKACK